MMACLSTAAITPLLSAGASPTERALILIICLILKNTENPEKYQKLKYASPAERAILLNIV